jgi:hypothetical protein
MATCKIGAREYALWKVAALAAGVLITIVGSGYGLSQAVLTAEDRWNQIDEFETNQREISEINLDVAAMQKNLEKQDARNDCQFWRQQYYLIRKQLQINPNDEELKKQKDEAEWNLKNSCERYEKLRGK